MKIIIVIGAYLRAVHSRSISGEMSRNALESSQAEQSGGLKGHLRLLHYGSEMSRFIYVQWIDGLEVEVIPSWETAMFIYQGRQYPPNLVQDAATPCSLIIMWICSSYSKSVPVT